MQVNCAVILVYPTSIPIGASRSPHRYSINIVDRQCFATATNDKSARREYRRYELVLLPVPGLQHPTIPFHAPRSPKLERTHSFDFVHCLDDPRALALLRMLRLDENTFVETPRSLADQE